MTKKEGATTAIYLAQIVTQLTAYYVNIQGAKTGEERKKMLTDSIETIKSFEKKLEKLGK